MKRLPGDKLHSMNGYPVTTSPLLIGHRGSSRTAPENTIASFRLAWAEGSDGIEADFRLTGDNRIVCMHDAGTGRTAGIDLQVDASRLEQLRKLDVGSWKGADWAGERIPTLPEVISERPDWSWFFMELKSGPEIIPHLEQVLLTAKSPMERVRLLSFSAQLIAELKQRQPSWRVCWLCDPRYLAKSGGLRPSQEEILATLRSIKADGLACASRGILDETLVKALHSEGFELHVWTVDSPARARQLNGLGVDSIITNRPGWLQQQMRKESRRP